MRATSALAVFGLLFAATDAAADTVSVTPAKDNSMYEDNPDNSAGADTNLFSGIAGAGSPRRALLEFDVAGAVPAGSTINSVTLSLFVERSGPFASGTDVYSLHRVTAAWGEGTSGGGAGVGVPATPGDATWNDRIFPTDPWGTAGGDFLGASGSTAMVTAAAGSFASSPGLVADVQSWLDDPANNEGWILIGDEATTFSARRFTSREGSPASQQPTLLIDFTPPAAVPAVSTPGLLALAAVLLGGVVLVTRRRAAARQVA